MNKSEATKMERQFQAEHDLRVLIDAEKIKKDKARYRAAMKVHKEQVAALASIKADGAPIVSG